MRLICLLTVRCKVGRWILGDLLDQSMAFVEVVHVFVDNLELVLPVFGHQLLEPLVIVNLDPRHARFLFLQKLGHRHLKQLAQHFL